jgi:hypothetical protein
MTIKALARDWAKHRTSIGVESGNFMRCPYGHETTRLDAIELAMQGLGQAGVNQISYMVSAPKYSVNLNVDAASRAMPNVEVAQQIPRTGRTTCYYEWTF